ncbi:MAG TPA: lactate racemase domain-containing protein [Alphaproteobacteria bacterium]|nr:lactate racemase domain-containing protein [Alphaproteobacteria bacterium]
MSFPKMGRVRQRFTAPALADVRAAVRQELRRLDLATRVKAGQRVAIPAGSRGIANLVTILDTVIQELRALGLVPFIFPAMGSHGGATAEGQREVLATYGVTEARLGVPIRATMEVVELGRTPRGMPLLVDKIAAEADWVVVVNRIKPHTEFSGDIESGLLKMLAIGFGNHRGALNTHQYAVKYGYRVVIPEVGAALLDRLPVLFGLGIVENAFDQTAKVMAIPPADFVAEEKRLLQEARALMARLPVEFLHLLIVDEMGKDISGSGMDTNVIGRVMVVNEPEPETPKIMRIYVRDLSEKTYGNAIGIGLADFCSQRLAAKIDPTPTQINCITAMTPEKARLPIALKTDREAIATALTTVGPVEPWEARVIRIKNTLEMEELQVSEAVMDELKGRQDITLIGGLEEMTFDADGNLPPIFHHQRQFDHKGQC